MRGLSNKANNPGCQIDFSYFYPRMNELNEFVPVVASREPIVNAAGLPASLQSFLHHTVHSVTITKRYCELNYYPVRDLCQIKDKTAMTAGTRIVEATCPVLIPDSWSNYL